MIPVPKGYSFAVAAAGFRKKDRNDLALLVSEVPATAAGVFTTNKFQAAPVLVAKENLAAGPTARAVCINSGQANACTGDLGLVNCRLTMELVGRGLGVAEEDILPASTGVIGDHLAMDKWKEAVPRLIKGLGQAGPLDFAKAIMTTDKFPKIAWASVIPPGEPADSEREIRIVGMAKGAGMICPNMATMLSVILCDAAVDPELWRGLLVKSVAQSFNRVTVDGDTSTNDTVFGLANGASGLRVDSRDKDFVQALSQALDEVTAALSYMVVEDAEGGTKVIRIAVSGAKTDAEADLAARAVGHSPLVKTAFYGRDPNWGRIVAALGRSGADFEPDEVRVSIAGIPLFKAGRPMGADLDSLLAPHLRRQDISLEISLGQGPGSAVLLASDLTHEYVSINAEYRS